MARHLSAAHRKAISEGLRRHHKTKGHRGNKKYTKSQNHAFERSKHSKSGHKSWRARKRQKRPGLWANYHAKKHREGRSYKRRRR